MNICLISQEYPPETNLGGIATYTQTLARQLAKMGQQVHVLTYAKEKEYVVYDLGVKVHRLLPQPKGELDVRREEQLAPYAAMNHWILGFSQRVYEYFLSLHEKEPFDLIEAPDTCAQALFIYKFVEGPEKIVRLHTPFFWVRHLNNVPDSPEHALRESLEKEQAFAATAVTSPTHALAEIVKEEWGLKEVPVIPNFFNLDNYRPDLSVYDRYLKGQKYIMYYGRFEYRKGVQVLAPALVDVLAKHDSLKVVFAGDDSMYNNASMKAGIEEVLGEFADRVVFIPNTPHDGLYPLIERSEFAVLPSLWENFPYACLEGMALGKVVVATTGGGFPEIIDDGLNGFLCPPGDSEALRERILDCLEREDLETVGRNAIEKVRAFDNGQVVGQMLDYYHSLIAKPVRKLTILYPTSMFPKLSETFILEQITRLIDMGHNVKVVAFWRPDEKIFHPQIEKYGLLDRTLYVPKIDGVPGFEFTPEALEFLQDVDIIHSHFAALPTDFAMHASQRLGIPFVFTTHAYDIFVHTPADKLADYAAASARIITVSKFNKRYMLDRIGEQYSDKIEIVRCGIDVTCFAPKPRAPKSEVVILTAGRFVEKKGLPYAIRAFAKLPPDCRAELRIIGDGPMRLEIEALVDELKLRGRVKLLGGQPQSAVVSEMQKADIFVLPSVTAGNNDREGLPVSLLEAQAMKLPVVSTLHTGIPEGVVDGVTGYLVSEKDVDALADRLSKLIADPDLRARMGDAGRSHVQKTFNIGTEAKKLETILNHAVDESVEPIRRHQAGNLAASPGGKIKVLFAAHSAQFFGAEQSFMALLEGLDRQKFEPIVILPENNPEGVFARRLKKLEIQTYVIDSPMRWIDFSVNCDPCDGLLAEMSTVDAYSDIIRQERIDLVYTNTVTKISAAIAAKLCGVPHIYHVREVLEDHPLRSAFSEQVTFVIICHLSSHLIANSNHVKDYVNKLCPTNSVTTVYNAIDPKSFKADKCKSNFRKEIKVDSGVPLVGIIGTVHSHKNHEDLVNAFAVLKQRGFSAKLVVIGHVEQEYYAHLLTLVGRHGLEDRVVFLPFRNDIKEVIVQLDLVVVCSLAEPFGRTTIEAMVAGKPVVATNAGASPEIVVDGVTGVLVPLRTPGKMADAIISVLSDREKAQNMGEAGKQRVGEVFTMERYVTGVENVLLGVHQTSRIGVKHVAPVSVPSFVKSLKRIIPVKDLEALSYRLSLKPADVIQAKAGHYDKGSGEAMISGLFGEGLPLPMIPEAKGGELSDMKNNPSATRLIALYLPQYHPIPENDEWWGNGFTEWRNVAKATPLFPGHYQPHLPSDLGFYDLRSMESRIEQADLASSYGIGGFCYYHYWFNGKRLLERPAKEMLDSGKPDFPFCLCWANENWTRRWDGEDQHVLMEQNHSEEDDRQHIQSLLPYFRDKRYIRVNGKPLFLVYRTENIPNPARTADVWREEAKKAGIGEIYLVRVESIGHSDPASINFDAAVEFAPDWSKKGPRMMPESEIFHGLSLEKYRDIFKQNYVHSYEAMAKLMMEKESPAYPWFRCVTPAWDNSARRKEGANIFVGSSPEAYQGWLGHAIADTRARLQDDEQIVFVNAWNEWAEGNHLEPDLKYGRAYLEATSNALRTDRRIPVAEVRDDIQPVAANTDALLKKCHEQQRILLIEKAGQEARYQKELAEKDKIIHELRNSASWRITTPVRWLHSRLFGIKGQK